MVLRATHISFTIQACAVVQENYEAACLHLFDALDKMEQRLEGQRYLIPNYPGGQAAPSPTLADYRLFTTLIRFDVVYYSLFKTNVRHIRDYPNLQVSPCRSYYVNTHLHQRLSLTLSWLWVTLFCFMYVYRIWTGMSCAGHRQPL